MLAISSIISEQYTGLAEIFTFRVSNFRDSSNKTGLALTLAYHLLRVRWCGKIILNCCRTYSYALTEKKCNDKANCLTDGLYFFGIFLPIFFLAQLVIKSFLLPKDSNNVQQASSSIRFFC